MMTEKHLLFFLLCYIFGYNLENIWNFLKEAWTGAEQREIDRLAAECAAVKAEIESLRGSSG